MIKEVSSENILPKDKLSSIKSKSDKQKDFKIALGKIAHKDAKNKNVGKKNLKAKDKQKPNGISRLVFKKIEKKSEDKEKKVVNVDFAVIENNIKSLKTESKNKNAAKKTEEAHKNNTKKIKANAQKINTKKLSLKGKVKVVDRLQVEIKADEELNEHTKSKDETLHSNVKNTKKFELKAVKQTQSTNKKTSNAFSKNNKTIQTKDINATQTNNIKTSKKLQQQNTQTIESKNSIVQIKQNKDSSTDNKNVVFNIDKKSDKTAKNHTENQQTLKENTKYDRKTQDIKEANIKITNKEGVKLATIEKISVDKIEKKEDKIEKINTKEVEKPNIDSNIKENRTINKEKIDPKIIEKTQTQQERKTVHKQENNKQNINNIPTQEKHFKSQTTTTKANTTKKIENSPTLNNKTEVKSQETDKQTAPVDIQKTDSQEKTLFTKAKQNLKQPADLHKANKNAPKTDIDRQTKNTNKIHLTDNKQIQDTTVNHSINTKDKANAKQTKTISIDNTPSKKPNEHKKEITETAKTQIIKDVKKETIMSNNSKINNKDTKQKNQINETQGLSKQEKQKIPATHNRQNAIINHQSQTESTKISQNKTDTYIKENTDKINTKHTADNSKASLAKENNIEHKASSIQNAANQTPKNAPDSKYAAITDVVNGNLKKEEHKKKEAITKKPAKQTPKNSTLSIHSAKHTTEHSEKIHSEGNFNTNIQLNEQKKQQKATIHQEEKPTIKLETSKDIKITKKDTETKDIKETNSDKFDLQTDKASQNTAIGTMLVQENHSTNAKNLNIPYPLDKVVEHIEHIRSIMKPPFDNSVTIKLNPPGLGLMEIRVKVDKDKHLTTTINADNREIFKIINAHADKLKDYLVSQGFKVENVNIQNNLQEHGGFGQNSQGGSFAQSQNQAQTNQRSQYYFGNTIKDDVKPETQQMNRQISKSGLDITV